MSGARLAAVTTRMAPHRARLALTVAAMTVIAVGCKKDSDAGDEDKPATAAVTCVVATAAQIDDTVEVTGVIAPPPKLDAIVSSPVTGRVSQVAVEEGDHVAAGALLATIEDPALPAGSLEAQAAVASARAAKTQGEVETARQERLVTAGIGARKDLDDARAKAAQSAAELDAANARAGLANKQLARRELRAPRAGVVLHLWKRVGESVDGTTATPIAEVADVSTLELHAQASPAALANVQDGMPATVRVIGIDKPFLASVVRVAPAVDPVTLLGSIRITIAGSESLKVGSAGSARIAFAQRHGLLVPPSALRRSLVGADEVVVCDNGTARVRSVKVGQGTERGVEIADGIKAGEQVVTDHVLGLEDGQALTPAKPAAASPPTTTKGS